MTKVRDAKWASLRVRKVLDVMLGEFYWIDVNRVFCKKVLSRWVVDFTIRRMHSRVKHRMVFSVCPHTSEVLVEKVEKQRVWGLLADLKHNNYDRIQGLKLLLRLK